MKLKRLFAFILSVCLVVTALPIAAFAGKPKEKYVALGDSYSNGFGMKGYYDYFPGDPDDYNNTYGYGVSVDGTYAKLFAEENNYEYIPLCYSAMRSAELHYLLDENYDGDQFTKRVFTYDGLFKRNYNLINGTNLNDSEAIAAIRAQYVNAVTDADVISIALGTNDFCNYVTSRICGLLGINSSKDDDHVEDLVMDEQLKTQVASLREVLKAKLADLLNDDTTAAFANEVIDAYLYAFANYAINIKADFELIRELNPNAKIIIVGLPDPENGFVINYGDTKINLGDIMQFINGMFDLLQASYTYNDANCYFAEIPNHTTSFFDELQENNISDYFLESFLNSFFYDNVRATVPTMTMETLVAIMKDIKLNGNTSVYYADFGGVYYKLEQVIEYFHNASKTKVIDFKAMLNHISELVQLLDSDNMLEDAMILSSQSEETKRAVDSIVYIYGRFMLNDGIISHPSADGHKEILASIKNALNNKITSKAYVDAKMKKFSAFVMNCLSGFFKNASDMANKLYATFYFGQIYKKQLSMMAYNWVMPTWTWSPTNVSATATFRCIKTGKRVAVVTDFMTEKRVVKTLNTETIIYTAKVRYNGKIYTTTKSVVVNKKPKNIFNSYNPFVKKASIATKPFAPFGF